MRAPKRLLIILAVAALLPLNPLRAFQCFQPSPTGFYLRNAQPDAQPPFTHWDLRAYAACSLPWSVRYPAGVFPPLDVDLNGANNNAADKAAVSATLAASLATWQAVDPAIVQLSLIGAVPGSQNAIARDKYNVMSFENEPVFDDQQCVPDGGAAGGPFAPVVAPGIDGVLMTQARPDDQVVPCIISGGDGNSDTFAAGDDVQIVLPGGAVPPGCNVVVTAGPNGKLDSVPNNAPVGAPDDVASACVVAGTNATSNTPANNVGSVAGFLALTGLFFNTSSGVIYEADIKFGAWYWSINAHGVAQPEAIVAGPDGDVDTTAVGDDTQNFPVGTVGLDQNAIVIGPGPNRIRNTPAAGGDIAIQTTDLKQVATHELGHTLGIAHPVDGRDGNDVQVVAPGPIAPNGLVVTGGPGAPPTLDTMPMGDDIVVGTTIRDGGNGIAETTANNAQLANSALASATNNIMNPFFGTGNTNHVLSIDDEMACNWLYTPDLGDAPDACAWAGGGFNRYQSKVHTTTVVDTLNALSVFDTAKGPVQLLGYRGPAAPSGRRYKGMRYEWLGDDMDDHALECEARLQDIDLFDDGVVFPDPLKRGQVNRFTVTLKHTNRAGRYILGDPLRHIYFNGYFDWTRNCVFDPAEREIFWDGIPGTKVSASGNWVSDVHSIVAHPETSTIIIEYDVFVPLNAAPEFYCRFRVDYGEDEARVRNVNGDLTSAERVAQYGEVEDRICRTVEVDNFPNSLAVVDIRVPANSPTEHLVTLTGPSVVHVDLGAIADNDLDGLEEVPTSMEQLELTGTDPTFGQVIVRRRDPGSHPFLPSTGQIEEDLNLTPATLDIKPFVTLPPNLTASTYFNIYPEVVLPSLALTLHTHAPKRMLGTLTHKPPAQGDTYWNPTFVPLYDSNEVLVAAIGPGYHTPDPPATPHEIDLFAHSTATVDVRMPPGSPVPNIIQLSGPSAVDVDLGGIADTDFNGREQVKTKMIGLDLQGTSGSFGNVRVKVRPSGIHPAAMTLGEIEEQQNWIVNQIDVPPFTTSPPGLAADSFFDVFFQVELQSFGNIPLHNHLPKRMSSVIHHKPPADGDSYQSPVFIDLFDPAENLVAQLGPGEHIPNPVLIDTGGCCTTSGCTLIGPSQCTAIGGDYMGGGTTCALCAPVGPPGVDNSVRAARIGPTGANLLTQWNGSSCPTQDWQIVYGFGAGLPNNFNGIYQVAGGVCSTGGGSNITWPAPSPAADPKRLLWFLVIANDPGSEGAWGKNKGNVDRKGPGPGGASNVCRPNKSVANTCGQVPP